MNEPAPPTKWEQIVSWIRVKFYGFWHRITRSKKRYIVSGIRPVGAPTYNPLDGLVATEPNAIAYDLLVRPRGEVITPLPEHTVEDICELMSQAACDHEFQRVIVYPIDGEKRREVLEILESPEGIIKYPMYEYRPANITNNDDLNAKTIIYKYFMQSHLCKPI